MSWNAAAHLTGWLCLLAMLLIALYAMYEVVAPQWRRILSLAAGNIEPAFSDEADDRSAAELSA
jgi:hypothetical protein